MLTWREIAGLVYESHTSHPTHPHFTLEPDLGDEGCGQGLRPCRGRTDEGDSVCGLNDVRGLEGAGGGMVDGPCRQL